MILNAINQNSHVYIWTQFAWLIDKCIFEHQVNDVEIMVNYV
jgi:hypothetical protein